MNPNFDLLLDRRATDSYKWRFFGKDVLPLWVADMDFPAPQPVLQALQARVEHGVFGYDFPSKRLRQTVAARIQDLYGWQVSPAAVVAVPGIVAAFNAAAHATCAPGEGILIQPPVYPPFLSVHANVGLVSQHAPLTRIDDDRILRYAIDFDAFEVAIGSSGARTGMFLLCHPHNPTGRVYTRDELTHLAEICLRHGVIICSDEIHSELLLGGVGHVPIAALAPEIAARTITLIAPSKTFNVAGLFCGFAIIPDADLRERFNKVLERLVLHVNSLGLVAAQAAFSGECEDWLFALREYLTANRDLVIEFVKENLPGIRTTSPDATYLAWLDCNALIETDVIKGSPHKFFLHQAKVALNEGAEFGPDGQGFVRLNFGCPRSILIEALERMQTALVNRQA